MAKPINYGGQAIIEGVMMRGSHEVAMAVRNPAGEIVVRSEPISASIYRSRILRLPLLRGLPLLWDSLGLGMKALMWSADIAVTEEEAPPSSAFQGALGWATGLIGVVVGLGVFMALPPFLVGLLQIKFSTVLDNLIEALVRLGFLIGYVSLVSLMPDIRRVFAYHGAEHKTINAYEAGAPLTVEAVRPFSIAHTRCGTAFLLTVAVISFLVFLPFGRPPLVWRVISRLVAIPVITGISYEWLRLSARYSKSRLMRWLTRPNLALQRFTTREPDDGMIEVAIRSLETVLAAEKAQEAEGLEIQPEVQPQETQQ